MNWGKLNQFHFSAYVVALVLSVGVTMNASADLPPDLQAKVETYKKKLSEWATNPVIVAAVKESNTKGGLAPGMTNSKWDELSEKDPVVLAFSTNEAGKLCAKWEEDKSISKLYLRDEKANLVASSNNKALLYNNGTKPPFVNGLKGVWASNEIKPDPASQVKGIHVSVPVVDGGKTIGVLQTSVVAE